MRVYKSYRKVLVSMVRETIAPHARPAQLRDPRTAANLLRSIIGEDPREMFLAVYLDTRHRLIAVHQVSIGTIALSMACPREIFGPAVSLHARALVVAHNHPSGDPAPSAEDRLATKRLNEAGELLGIDCLDHLILGAQGFYSMAEDRTQAYGGDA
jgi:DNA repair protein RadC